MKTVSVIDILKGKILINTKITVNGWLRTKRNSKCGISFLSIYDGSCFNTLQVIVKNNLLNYKSNVLKLTTGCSLSITGKLVKSLGKDQLFEIQTENINIIGWINNPNTYPISAKHHSLEHIREFAHLRPRTKLIGSITRIRHTVSQTIHHFMDKNGFFWISTPIITSLNTEGSGEMFRVSTLDFKNIPHKTNGDINYKKDFFGKEAFLTVSGQLNGESYACSLSKIYTFGPTFRAEKSNTSRHLAEFWMIEPELAFSSLEEISILAEKMLKYIFKKVLIKRIDDMKYLVEKIDKEVIKRLENLINKNFIKISYTEAIKILKLNKDKFKEKNSIFWGLDLTTEHERFLTEKYFKSPVIIKNFPKDIKSFYMKINNDNKTVAAIDILVPGIGEIIGGSEREYRLDILNIRMKEVGLKKTNYWWYLDLRRYGTIPHAGFGLGLERLIMYITGIKNIRDVIPFPRSQNNIYF